MAEAKAQPAVVVKPLDKPNKEDNSSEKKRIKSVWDIFDKDKKKNVSKDDIGTIMRALSAFPTEEELEGIVRGLKEEDDSQAIKFERFEPFMVKVMVERLYEPDSEEVILQAFKLFDPDNKKYLDESTMQEILTDSTTGTGGFKDKEVEAFMAQCRDPETGVIYYEKYLDLLTGAKAF